MYKYKALFLFIILVITFTITNKICYATNIPIIKLGSYEVKNIKVPNPKQTYYLGDTVNFEFAAGKNIKSLVLEFPPNEEQTVTRNNSNENFKVTYTIPKTTETIGNMNFYVRPIYETKKGTPSIKYLTYPINLDIREEPKSITISYEDNGTLNLSKSEINKASILAPLPGSVPLDIEAQYTSGNYTISLNIGSFSIADQRIAIVKSEAISKYAPNKKMTVIRPLKKGSTKLTTKYKNISKTINLIVTD